MAYGIQLFNDDGSLQWDSSVAGGGVVVDSVTVPANTSIQKSYPQFPSRTIKVITNCMLSYLYNSNNPFVIDYSSGYPKVTFPTNTASIIFTLVVL